MSTTEQKKKGGPKKTTANPAKEIKEPINQELTGSPEVKEPEINEPLQVDAISDEVLETAINEAHEEVKDLEQEVQSTITNTNLDEIVNLEPEKAKELVNEAIANATVLAAKIEEKMNEAEIATPKKKRGSFSYSWNGIVTM